MAISLYHVQDSDRPAWVIATSWQAALDKWKWAVAKENDETSSDVGEPDGIQLVCDATELIVDELFENPL